MKLKPANRVVVVKPTTFKSGNIEVIIVNEKERPEVGEVVAIGKSVKKEDPPIAMKKGDLITYRRFGEKYFFLDGTEYLFVSFDDVLGIVEGVK